MSRPADSSPARCSPADASPWSCQSPAREQALMSRGFTEQGLAIRRHVLDDRIFMIVLTSTFDTHPARL